jgi:hypothetical protein
MKTQHMTSTMNSRRRLITSGLVAVILTSMAFGIAPAKASSGAGVYSCANGELHTHLERRACGD